MPLLTDDVNMSESISLKFSFISYQDILLYLSHKVVVSTDKMMYVKWS